MAQILSGKEVAAALDARLIEKTYALANTGITPTLAIIRCGENPADISYEKGAASRAEKIGVNVVKFTLPANVEERAVKETIAHINADSGIHGCLMLRPLPNHLRPHQEEICNALSPLKDVDCMTDISCAGVLTGKQLGFAPCTPRACIEILDYYGIQCEGAHAVIIGRSLVVGKPLAMMLLAKNATVTVCHTKTKNLAAITWEADIIITSAGALNSLNGTFVTPGQTVIDVSINWDENKINSKGQKGAIAGDAAWDEVEPIVGAITPVPGGVGTVTTSVLIAHTVEAAERAARGI